MTIVTDSPGRHGLRDDRLAVVIAVVWSAGVILLQWGRWGEDIMALYMAGYFWAHGRPDLVYAAPGLFFGGTSEAWLPAMADLGIADRNIFPFVYPPIWAVLMAPVTQMLSPQGFCDAVSLVQIPMIAAAALLTGRMARPDDWSLTQWTVLTLMLVIGLLPGIGAVHFIQPTITSAFLTILSVDRLRARRPAAAGIALAVAAALKLSPVLFVAVFAIDRQWRALAVFALAGAMLGLLSLIAAGAGLHWVFLDALRHATGSILSVPGNFTLRLLLVFAEAMRSGMTGILFTIGPQVITPADSTIAAIATGGTIVAVTALARAVRNRPADERRTLALIGMSLIVPLFGPIGWMHYYLLPMLFAAALPSLIATRWVWLPLGSLGILLLKPVFDAFKTFVPGQSIYITVVTLLWLVLLIMVLVPRSAQAPASAQHGPAPARRGGSVG